MYAAIVELLLELEGVDPEPDFWARSARGPWHIAVNEDCAQQFQAKYGDLTNIRVLSQDIPVRIMIASIEGKLNKKGTTSRKALYEALQDVAAHIPHRGRSGRIRASFKDQPERSRESGRIARPHVPQGKP